MKREDPCAVWRRPLADQRHALNACVDKGLNRFPSQRPHSEVFFRADDIAVPTDKFRHLLSLFARYQTPLAMAVVPTWLTALRWRELVQAGMHTPRLWCWHQHGWQHKNHAHQGKKAEFGDNRPRENLRGDIVAGQQRLKTLMPESLQPLFTPPWNRCGSKALGLLSQLGFKAVSRDTGSRPGAPSALTEWNVNVDLHTRKETDSQSGYRHLMAEIEAGIASGVCGIMIHHDRMNSAAFTFLEQLLAVMAARPNIRLVNLAECLQV